MSEITLTRTEINALKSWWKTPIRVKDGNVESKKGQCWGILCSAEKGKKEAQLIIERSKKSE